MKDLKNKVAIITGASGGMGRVISEMLADKGVKLALYSSYTVSVAMQVILIVSRIAHPTDVCIKRYKQLINVINRLNILVAF